MRMSMCLCVYVYACVVVGSGCGLEVGWDIVAGSVGSDGGWLLVCCENGLFLPGPEFAWEPEEIVCQ